MATDLLFLIPANGSFDDLIIPSVRQAYAAQWTQPIMKGVTAFYDYLGTKLPEGRDVRDWPVFSGRPIAKEAMQFRTLTAVCIATQLERAGISWEIVDPGALDLGFWRKRLEKARQAPPKCIGISTTFVLSDTFLSSMCALVREYLPHTKLLLGGSYYVTSPKRFLALDGDVICVGEAELRLPEIVKAITEKRSLDDIPGIYLRRSDGTLYSTGRSEPVPLARLPLPDWKLAERIEPKVDITNASFGEIGVETQRGCVFKCEYCTFRTTTNLSIMPVDEAVETIFHTREVNRGVLLVHDPTATFPHQRWREIMTKVAERGGAPHPMWCFARVSDLQDDSTVALMAKAGFRSVFIGQEHADQRMLNLMRKGTRVEEIRPALEALHRNGIISQIGLIFGFPGETDESVEVTRKFLATVNQSWPDKPVVYMAHAIAFMAQDMATTSLKQRSSHYLDYGDAEFTFQKTLAAMLETIIQAAKVPHSPVFGTFGGLPADSSVDFTNLVTEPHVYEVFRFLKALDYGGALFVEQELTGKKPNPVELERCRAEILARLPKLERPLGWRLRGKYMQRVVDESAREAKKGVGLATRFFLGQMTYDASGSLWSAVRSFTQGQYWPELNKKNTAPQAESDQLAEGLRTDFMERARIAKIDKAFEIAVQPLPTASETQ